MSRRRDRIIAERLVAWFDSHARDLPWRAQRDGYTALVAEAMLQQTQVSRVIERYETFLKRFPTVIALAAASEQDVLALWQGLGYYRRARHLHAAAKQIVLDHGGEVPRTSDALQKLPGVGRYTAGAIASIAFSERVSIVDGNVARVLARLAGRAGDVRDREGEAWCWDRAAAMVEVAEDPGVCNEAMMELGALVCTPQRPQCEACPLASLCIARRQGEQAQIPAPAKAAPRSAVHHHAMILVRRGRLLIEQRPLAGLWAGLWQVPTVESIRCLSPAIVSRRIARRLAIAPPPPRRVRSFVHHTTHREVTFHVFEASAPPSGRCTGEWRSFEALEDVPFGSPQRRIVELAVS